MTKEQVKKLNLGIAPIDDRVVLLVESAFHWVNDNTVLSIAYNDDQALNELTPNVKLFVLKYFDVMSLDGAVSSESIEGLSQSFSTSNKSDLLWQYAYELFGDKLKSQMTFTTAKSRWY